MKKLFGKLLFLTLCFSLVGTVGLFKPSTITYAEKELPDGYTLLEYIYSDGNEYLDTGINASYNLTAVMDFMPLEYSDSFILGTCKTAYAQGYTIQNCRWTLFNKSSNTVFGMGGMTVEGKAMTNGKRYVVDLGRSDDFNYINLNNYGGDVYYSQQFSWGSQVSLDHVCVFGGFNESTVECVKMRLYSLKMFESGELVRDFVPCKENSSKKIGLYDKVGKAFYSSETEYPFLEEHDVSKVDGVFSTTEKDGYKDAYYCSVCECYFEDEECTKRIGYESDYKTWKTADGYLEQIVDGIIFFDGDFRYKVVSAKDKTVGVMPLTDNLSKTYFGEHFQITIPESATYSNTEFTVTELMDSAFENVDTINIYLPSTLLKLGKRCFYNVSKLEPFVMPDAITEIPDYAFYGCVGLNTFDFPSELKKIGDYAFQKCKIYRVELPSKVESIGKYAFEGTSVLTTLTMPNTVKSIGEYAFKGCNWLETVVLSSGLEEVSKGTFENCKGLVEVVIQNGVEGIWDSAFNNCANLKKVSLPSSLLYIGEMAFNACGSLNEITLPENLFVIKDSAFYDCTNLSRIYLLGSEPPTFSPLTFKNCQFLYFENTVYVPLEYYDNYHESPYWKDENLCGATIIVYEGDYRATEEYTTGIRIPYYLDDYGFRYVFSIDGKKWQGEEISDSFRVRVALVREVAGKNPTCEEGGYVKYYESHEKFYKDELALNEIDVDAYTSAGGEGYLEPSHDWSNKDGVCAICKNKCIHTDANEDGICDVCGYDLTPRAEIKLCNIAFQDNVYILFGVQTANFDGSPELLVWQKGDNEYLIDDEDCTVLTPFSVNYEIDGQKYIVYAYEELSAKQMTDEVYAKVKVGYNYSRLYKYSIIEYACQMIDTTSDDGLKLLLTQMLSYGTAAQKYFNYNLDRLADGTYYKVNLENATFSDGSRKSMCLSGQEITASDKNVKCWTKNGDVVQLGERRFTCIVDEPLKICASPDFVYLDDITVENGVLTKVNKTNTISIFREGIKEIGEGVFAENKDLKGVLFSYGLTTVGTNAFTQAENLEFAILPSSVNKLAFGAFSDCHKLKTVSNLDGVKQVGSSAFWSCFELERLDFSADNLTGIGTHAFEYCHKLAFIGGTESVAILGESAFYKCSSLHNLTFSERLRKIEENAFAYCSTLTEFVCPKYLKTIVGGAFAGCNGLYRIVLNETLESIGEGAFDVCSNLVEIENYSSLEIEKGDDSHFGRIGYYALNIFDDEEGQSKITYVDDVAFYVPGEDGGDNLFLGYTGQEKEFSIGDVGFDFIIKTYGFMERYYFTAIDFGPRLVEIKENAMIDCDNLYAIGFSKNCNPNSNAIWECDVLTRLDFDGTRAEVEKIQEFTYASGLIYAICSDGYYLFKTTNGITVDNGKISGIGTCTDDTVVIGGFVSGNVIDVNAFKGNTTIKKLIIGGSIGVIDDGAFEDCTSIEEIIFEEREISLQFGNQCFKGCTSLKNLEIPSGDIVVGNNVFDDCTSLTVLKIIDGVEYIGSYKNCTSLETVIFPNKVQGLLSDAFYGCTSIQNIVISSDDVSTLGSDSFKDTVYKIKVFYEGEESTLEGMWYYYDFYYYSEFMPLTEGNFWHYEDGLPVVW